MKLLLFSGGIDSSAIAFWKKPDVAVTFDYGQRPARGEIRAAKAIASKLRIKHEIVEVDLSQFGIGDLAGKGSSKLSKAPEWWPYRNQMLVTVAAMAFVPKGLKQIMIGAVSTDVHADGKPTFIKTLDALMSKQEGGVRVTAPAIGLTGEELLRRSKFPLDLIGLTFSCHVMEYACGRCRGCTKHTPIMTRALKG